MFKKKDLFLIAFVLVLAAGLFLYQYLSAKGTVSSGTVRITTDGELFGEYPLSEPRDILVRQENGCENVVRITGNGFYMLSANCHNQLCIHQGEVTPDNYPLRSLGTHVLCLPNRVDVELLVQSAPDQMDIPDI